MTEFTVKLFYEISLITHNSIVNPSLYLLDDYRFLYIHFKSPSQAKYECAMGFIVYSFKLEIKQFTVLNTYITGQGKSQLLRQNSADIDVLHSMQSHLKHFFFPTPCSNL